MAESSLAARTPHPLQRDHAVCLRARRGIWLLDPLQSRPRPGGAEIRPVLCDLSDGRVGRGHFLSTFILITQNRMSAAADKRAELDLQISLLAEHEVTKLVALLSAIADRLGVETDVDAEVEELKEDVAPEAVLDEIEERRQ